MQAFSQVLYAQSGKHVLHLTDLKLERVFAINTLFCIFFFFFFQSVCLVYKNKQRKDTVIACFISVTMPSVCVCVRACVCVCV